jgi:hypothetical protein
MGGAVHRRQRPRWLTAADRELWRPGSPPTNRCP